MSVNTPGVAGPAGSQYDDFGGICEAISAFGERKLQPVGEYRPILGRHGTACRTLASSCARRYKGRMHSLFDILIPISLAAVLLTLFVGIYALFRGGDFGRSYSNKLMRLRVLLQFIAILILVAAFWWNRHH
jgi:hypothetical protein